MTPTSMSTSDRRDASSRRLLAGPRERRDARIEIDIKVKMGDNNIIGTAGTGVDGMDTETTVPAFL
jgi:hypothetical protein